MTIEIKNKDVKTFRDILCGEIFANTKNELFIRCIATDKSNAVSIQDGLHHCFGDSTPVKRVKAITVEFE